MTDLRNEPPADENRDEIRKSPWAFIWPILLVLSWVTLGLFLYGVIWA